MIVLCIRESKQEKETNKEGNKEIKERKQWNSRPGLAKYAY
jgi:hypothetical protein